MALQESGEMYLETIYILLKENPTVRAIDVGEHMGFSKPSVSRAMGLLRDSGYITTDGSGYFEEMLPLPGYQADVVWLQPTYSRTTVETTPVTIPIK